MFHRNPGVCTGYRLTYRLLPRQVKWQVWLTGGWWGVLGVSLWAFVDDPKHPLTGASVFTLPNLMAVAGMLISVGTIWQQFQDTRARISALQAKHDELRDEHLPDTYVRKDVFEERWQQLESTIRHPPAARR